MKVSTRSLSQILLLALAALTAVQADTINVGIATSAQTDSSYKDWLSANLGSLMSSLNTEFSSQSVDFNLIQAELTYEDQSYPASFASNSVKVVIDVTQDFDLSQIFVFQALQEEIFHVVLRRALSYRNSEMISDYTVFMANSVVGVDNKLIYDLVTEFEWQKSIGIVKTSDLNMLKVARDFKTEAQVDPNPSDGKDEPTIKIGGDIIIELGISNKDEALIESRLKENLRLNDVRFIIIFGDDETASNVLEAGFKILNGAGYAWIISPTGRKFMDHNAASKPENATRVGGIYENGVITFEEKDSFSSFEEELKAVLRVTAKGWAAGNKLGAPLKTYFISNSSADSFSLDSTGARVIEYHIQNSKNGNLENIGVWNSKTRAITWSVDKAGGILWPGNKSEIPDDDVATVTLALLYPKGTPAGDSILKGCNMGIEYLTNNSKLKDTYQFQIIEHDTKGEPGTAADVVKEMQTESFLGIIGPVSGEVTQAYLEHTKDLKKSTISIGADWPDLASPQKFDSNVYYFLTMVQSVSAMSKAIVLYLSNNNWKDIAVIYTRTNGDDSYDSKYGQLLSDAYEKNLDGGIKQTIRSTNSVPHNLQEEDMDKVNKVLRNVVRHKARIILFFGHQNDGLIVAREANKWKLWGEDYLWLGANWLPDNLVEYLGVHHPDDKNTILEVLEGAVSVKVQPKVSSQGGQFYTDYKAKYGDAEPAPEAYFSFDAVRVYGEAVEGMVDKGVDFANTDLLSSEIRSNIEFAGATGNIKFRSSANDRLGVVQTFMNYQGPELGMIAVTDFKIEGSHVFVPVPDVKAVYGELASSSPSGEIVDNGCSFDDNNVSYNAAGFAIVTVLCLVIFGLTIGLATISNKKWRSIEVKKIGRETEKTWKDWAIQIFIVVEFFQFLALAPLFLAQSDFLQRIVGLAMFDLLELIGKGADPKFFWISVNVVISFSFLWFFLVLLNMLNIESHLNRKPTLQKLLNTLTNLLLPLIGNTCFLPFTKLLVDIFVCHQTVFEGIDGYEHTFVERDCFMECWTGEHTIYVIMGVFALFLYLPFAVFSRPLWEKAKVDVNIQLSTTFLLTKTCVQVFIIALRRIVIDELIHSILFLIAFGGFIYVTYKKWPFNYDVINLWQLTIFCGIFYYSFLAFLGIATDTRRELIWLILLLCGWAVGALVAFIIQKKKFKILLKTPKRKHTSLFARLDSKRRGNTLKSEQAKLVKSGIGPK
mmetsp:Transcript_45487/g.52369  ORF Transcript_45487/g.52369 Transcript_45487/m.52369 type:complete len:1218 (+) Transcript_45487:43-3696(+)